MTRQLDSLPPFDPFNADWLRDPFEVVGRELSTDDWCALGPMGTLFVWSYTGVMDLAESEGWHAPSVEETSLGQITSGHAAEFAQNVTSFLEGDRRRRIRTAPAMPLAPAEVERFRSTIATTAARLVSEVDPPFDLVKLCYRLPVEVFASITGAPLSDLEAIASDVEQVAWLWGFDAGQHADEIELALPRLRTFVEGLMDTAEPGSLFPAINKLDLPRPERVWSGVQALIAGWETSAAQAGCLLEVLLRDSDRWDAVLAGKWDVADVVTEALRLRPAVAGFMRVASNDMEWQGLQVPAGTLAFGSAVWASRDAAVFDDPHTFDPNRPDAPLPVWGGGRHRCLGRHLGTIEMVELLQAVVNAQPRWRMTGPVEWTNMRRPRLPVSLVVDAG